MKKVLITGANGYIGARLSRFFAENAYRVTAVCYPEIPPYKKWIDRMEEVVVGDLRDDATIARLTGKRFDAVIHLVSLDHHQSEGKADFVSSVNVLPAWRLLEGFSKTSLEKFIYFSTVQVYGKIGDEVISEARRPTPANIYGLTHFLSEEICAYFSRTTKIQCSIVRLSNSYGSPLFIDNNCWWLVINDLCKNAYSKKRMQLLSDGSPQRDFIHGNDVCRAVQILIEGKKTGEGMQTYHIASGKTVTILELAHKVKEIYQKRYGTTIDIYLKDNTISENADAFNSRNRYRFDTSKMQALGFGPSVDLVEGITGLFEFLERHQPHQ